MTVNYGITVTITVTVERFVEHQTLVEEPRTRV